MFLICLNINYIYWALKYHLLHILTLTYLASVSCMSALSSVLDLPLMVLIKKYTKHFHVQFTRKCASCGIFVSKVNMQWHNMMLFQKKFGYFCDSHDFVNFASLTLIVQGNQGGSMLQAPRLREVQQNEGFESCSAHFHFTRISYRNTSRWWI